MGYLNSNGLSVFGPTGVDVKGTLVNFMAVPRNDEFNVIGVQETLK